jgi:hypothetical protein
VSKFVIVKLKIDKDKKRILELKARSRKVADKGKHTEEYIMETSLKEYREKKLMELQYLSIFNFTIATLEASIPTCTEAPLTFSLCILSVRFP